MLREVSGNMAFNRDDMTCVPHMADLSEYVSLTDDNPAEIRDSCLGSLLSLSESIAEVVASPQAYPRVYCRCHHGEEEEDDSGCDDRSGAEAHLC